MLIYLATSWRNERQPFLVEAMRKAGFDVYDFRNPTMYTEGFAFEQVAPGWDHEHADPEIFLEVLAHERTEEGFVTDMAMLDRADIVILALPCGHDAHMEIGYAAAQGKETVILLSDPCKASLMYKMADRIFTDEDTLLRWLEKAGRTGEIQSYKRKDLLNG